MGTARDAGVPQSTEWVRPRSPPMDVRHSVSLQLRPDIVIQVRDTMHVLDAKLRVDRGDDEAKRFKWEDIAKMYAYRDALPAVRTAFVLYPGDEAEAFEVGGADAGAVGAIPLVPGVRGRVSLSVFV